MNFVYISVPSRNRSERQMRSYPVCAERDCLYRPLIGNRCPIHSQQSSRPKPRLDPPRFEPPEDCSICSEPMATSAPRTLSCGHSFHLRCVSTWLDQAGTCPICRHEEQSNEGVDESDEPLDPELSRAVLRVLAGLRDIPVDREPVRRPSYGVWHREGEDNWWNWLFTWGVIGLGGLVLGFTLAATIDFVCN